MIDGLFKRHIDPLWEKLAQPLAKRLTANQVTLLGFGISLALCAAYGLWHSEFWFGLGLIIAFAADSLDGAVARIRREQSKFGGYLDAMTDRYQELCVYGVIAYVNDLWPVMFVLLGGTYLTSYAKARTAVEQNINNAAWPDLFERQERVIFTCGLLIIAPLLSPSVATEVRILSVGFWILAALTHVTALQRMRRAKALLIKPAQPLPASPLSQGESPSAPNIGGSSTYETRH